MIIDDVRLRYPGSSDDVLKGGRCVLFPGRPWRLTGINGAGKSTWLRVVAGLLPRSQGTISLDGEGLRRGQASYSDPVPAVFDELTAYEHIELISDLWLMKGREREKYHRDVTDALEEIDLSGLNQRVENYSSGMREKLSLCLILGRDSPIVLLDEPLSATDLVSRAAITRRIVDRSKIDIVVIVSHSSEITTPLNPKSLDLRDGIIYET